MTNKNTSYLTQRIEETLGELRSIWQTTRENEGKYEKVKSFIRTALTQIAEEARKSTCMIPEHKDENTMCFGCTLDTIQEARQEAIAEVVKLVEEKQLEVIGNKGARVKQIILTELLTKIKERE